MRDTAAIFSLAMLFFMTIGMTNPVEGPEAGAPAVAELTTE